VIAPRGRTNSSVTKASSILATAFNANRRMWVIPFVDGTAVGPRAFYPRFSLKSRWNSRFAMLEPPPNYYEHQEQNNDE
jgi:hypothetical protein